MTHYYTPEEANKILPQVRAIVSKIVELRKLVETGSEKKRNAYVDELGIQVSKLEELGVDLKDMSMGLADFPAMRFDEPVCLCWKLGESEVSYWHGMTEGFKGRKLLRPEPLEAR